MPVVTVIGGNGAEHVYVQYDTVAYSALATSLLGSETNAFLISSPGSASVPSGVQFVGIGSSANAQGVGSVAVTDSSLLTDQLILVGNGTDLSFTASEAAGGTIIAGDGTDNFNLNGGSWLVDGGAATTVGLGAGDSTVAGAASVFGGSGALTYFGGTSDATVVAGTGSNMVFGANPGTTTSVFLSATGDTTVVGGVGATTDIIGSATAGGTPATVFGGGSGTDINFSGATSGVLVAGSGNETLNAAGSTGDNSFFAGSGSDVITAGSGSDTLFGGAGDSTLTGGSGSDLFAFASDAGGNTITISDFTSSDLVGLSGVTVDTTTAGTDSTTLMLSDNTTVVFQGVTDLNPADIINF